MEFVNIAFPDRIAFQAKADSMWLTTVTALLSGFESTNQQWAQVRHAYDAGLAVRVASDYLLVKAHFNQMRGRAKSFPFFDPIDHSVAQAAGVLTQQASSPNNEFQMFYRYGSGADLYDRKITRPKTGTVRVFRTRSMVTTDVTSSSTIDYATGEVLISGGMVGDTYAWSGDFFVPCRYDIDRLPGVVSNKEPASDGEFYVTCDSIPIVEVRE